MVIGTNVVCRAQPGRNAAKVVTLRLGEIRGFSREARAEGGIWYFDEGRPSCWLPGPLTAEFVAGKPESAFIGFATVPPAPDRRTRYQSAQRPWPYRLYGPFEASVVYRSRDLCHRN